MRQDSLKRLREPFEANLISKLPKPTKAQTEAVKAEFKKGMRCQICGTWHHPDVVHLDYVGHAALTDRLLDVDPEWTWEPLSVGEDGLPVIDGDGGLWIRLTICGVTRLGYGDAQGKTGGNAMKERIGDALRNAGMRFGAALDLWHKGDLHAAEEEQGKIEQKAPPKVPATLRLPKLKTNDYEVSPERSEIIQAAAKASLDAFMLHDNDKGAYEEVSGITDNDEKSYLWAIIAEYPSLRRCIKEMAGRAE